MIVSAAEISKGLRGVRERDSAAGLTVVQPPTTAATAATTPPPTLASRSRGNAAKPSALLNILPELGGGQVAHILGVASDTVARHADQWGLTYTRDHRGYRRYDTASVYAYRDRRARQP